MTMKLLNIYNPKTDLLFNTLFDDIINLNTLSSINLNKLIDKIDYNLDVFDYIENENQLEFEFNFAGIKKDNISINLEDNKLNIKAEINKNERKKNYHLFTKYEKTIELPSNVDKEKIEAIFSDGILKITIPKTKNEKKNNNIEIKIK